MLDLKHEIEPPPSTESGTAASALSCPRARAPAAAVVVAGALANRKRLKGSRPTLEEIRLPSTTR